jgi:adenine-specific DNA methylase
MQSSRLARRLEQLTARAVPLSWMETGAAARPNLHGLLRYPAMMVPRMQGDILDCILDEVGLKCDVLDPFVGSGTMLTESAVRGLNFTGVDINPLAVLVCDAKAAIDAGADFDRAAQSVIASIRRDVDETIDVEFPNRDKWFSDENAITFSRLRRSIQRVPQLGARKVLWTVFAETIRSCSNSRTSTYKLHIRPTGDYVPAERVAETFERNLRHTLARISEYRTLIASARRRPDVQIICGDVRKVRLPRAVSKHRIMVTSPPYGDNVTTIPYGQFSYLALRWIPGADLSDGVSENLLENTHALDSASLGGTSADFEFKEATMRFVSPSFDAYVASARMDASEAGVRKVSCFMYDMLQAASRVRDSAKSSCHWVITTGNRTAGGVRVPFDSICGEIVSFLGGRRVAVLNRVLPSKRMPSKNSQGEMITTESTLVAEFA